MSDVFATQFDLSSGFTVKVQPLPPYYADFIEDYFPYIPLPKRQLQLAGGDVIELDYEVPENVPDSTDEEEFSLYMRHKVAVSENKKLSEKRERTKRDYLLSTCVDIQSGPVEVDSNEWEIKLQAVNPNIEIPTHDGARLLMFLKYFVIRTPQEMTNIIKAAMFPEVTAQGIQHALRGFPSKVEQHRPDRHHRSKARA